MDADGTNMVQLTDLSVDANNAVFRPNYVATVYTGISPPSRGIAVWAENGTSRYNQWDGTSFGTEGNSADLLDEFRIIQGAEAPTRDEAIVVGVAGGGHPRPDVERQQLGRPADQRSGHGQQGQVVGLRRGLRTHSGDAVLVWNDKPNLSTASGTDRAGLHPRVTAYSGADPSRCNMAASPDSDEMVLIISDKDNDDWAMVWNGSSWGNQIALTGVDSQNVTDVSVTYEQLSGDAMVVYAKDQTDVHYRTWNGSSWSAEGTMTAPSGPRKQGPLDHARFRPQQRPDCAGRAHRSQRCVFRRVGRKRLGRPGQDLATLEPTTETTPTWPSPLRTTTAKRWRCTVPKTLASVTALGHPGAGWSSEMMGPNLGDKPTSMTLDTDPATNAIMLSVLDEEQRRQLRRLGRRQLGHAQRAGGRHGPVGQAAVPVPVGRGHFRRAGGSHTRPARRTVEYSRGAPPTIIDATARSATRIRPISIRARSRSTSRPAARPTTAWRSAIKERGPARSAFPAAR